MNSAETQIPMSFSPGDTRVPENPWLGFVTDHRRLFDGLQDGWLRPLPSHAGVLLGIKSFASDREVAREGHSIEVHLKLDPEKLPELDIYTPRSGKWTARPIRKLATEDTVVYWPGVLPAFAIREITVSTDEERSRLLGMARFASNLMLAEESVRVDAGPQRVFSAGTFPPEESPRLVLPKAEDAIHGAMTMAVWAVPRIDPWLDLLTASLASGQTRLGAFANRVDASWWRFPPWTSSRDDSVPTNPQDRLWQAATDTLSGLVVEDRITPSGLAARIADAGARCARPGDAQSLDSWLADSRGILRGESAIRLDDWEDLPGRKGNSTGVESPRSAQVQDVVPGSARLAPRGRVVGLRLCAVFFTDTGGWMSTFAARRFNGNSFRFSRFEPVTKRHGASTGRLLRPVNLAGVENLAVSY